MTSSKKAKFQPYNFLQKLFGRVEKRKRFILASFMSILILLSTTFFSFEELYIFLPLIFITIYFLTFFSILDGISRHEWVTLFIHPVLFSIIIYLFYFFLPQRWLTRLPFIIIYAVSIYAILLSQNIFNVGVSKSIQLFRAAFSVNFLFLTITSYMAYSLIISLRLNFLLNFILVFSVSFPLVLQFLWSVEPRDLINKNLIRYAILIALILGEAAITLSFIPVKQPIFALMLTAIFYSLNGLFQVYLQGSLFKERIREFTFVLGFALLVFILTLRW